jgi:lipopolysaccharide heptosyltransferase II
MDWTSAKRILCIRLDSLGDVLMTEPAIRALKETGTDRSITLLTSVNGAAAAELIPIIDDVIVYDPPWMKASVPQRTGRQDRQMIERLQNVGFDAAVIFTVYSQSALPAALMAFLANIPLRLATCRENPYQLLTDWVKETEPGEKIRHEVRRQLDLVATVGARPADERIRIQVAKEDCLAVEDILEGFGIDTGKNWIAVHPGATAASRRYAPEKFASAARALYIEHGVTSVFTGSEGEIPLVETIRKKVGVKSYSLAGRLSLGKLAALISASPLLLSNNSGPVHLAAGVGTPVVDLYALTNPQHTPWMTPNRVLSHDVPCKYCYKSVCPLGHQDCLAKVSPDEVVRAVVDLLEEEEKDRVGRN